MSNVFQTCLKDFKLKNIVVEPKTAQPVKPDEKPVDLFSSIGWKVQKPSLCSRILVQPVEEQLRDGRGPTVTYQALNACYEYHLNNWKSNREHLGVEVNGWF